MIKKRLLLMVSMFVMMAVGGAAAASDKGEVLTARQESIVVISAFAAQGDLDNLKTALAEGLDKGGLTVNEEKEILIQLYAYAGFPRSLNGLNTLIAVLDERKAQGIADTMGPDAAPVDPNRDRYAIGDANQTNLVGRPVTGRTYEFAPTISTFLKEHLFGDIFERTVLTWNERELATVSMLAGIGNVNGQLASHMNVAMHNGVTPGQLKAMTKILTERVGKTTGDNAAAVAQTVLSK